MGAAAAPAAVQHARAKRAPHALCLATTSLAAAGASTLLVLALYLQRAAAHVPWSLTNFQEEYACDTSVRLVRPRTVQDVQAAVRYHSKVKAVGGGWSWNGPSMCAPPTSAAAHTSTMPSTAPTANSSSAAATAASAAAANIATAAAPALQLLARGLRTVTDGQTSTLQAPQPPPAANATGPAGQHTSANIIMTTLRPLIIDVDEEKGSVLVDAGVRTYDLLQYLGVYVTRSAPAGWTLPAFPWFVYQTIGGAVSTGTHGSSLPYKSLSSQVLELHVVLANGTAAVINDESHPFFMKALRVSVGQLAVITHVRLRIVRELPVQRTLRRLPASQYLALLREGQAEYNRTGSLPAWANETEWFWITQRHEFLMVSYVRADATDPAASSALLSAYAPENTTLYNTSLAAVQDMALTQYGKLPLRANVRYDPATGLSVEALEQIRQYNNTIINAPWTDSPPDPPPAAAAAAANDTAPPPVAADAAAGSAPPTAPQQPQLVHKQQGPAQAAPDGAVNGVASGNAIGAANTTLPPGVQRVGEEVQGVSWTMPSHLPATFLYALPGMATTYLDISRTGVHTIAYNATLEPGQAYLYQPKGMMDNIRTVLYDQYEVSVPVGSMADCWAGLLELMYGDDIDGLNATANATQGGEPDYGFRTAPLIRLTGAEPTTLLSASHDSPHIWLNIEDYLYYNGAVRKSNTAFKRVMGYLRSDPRCGTAGLKGAGGRLHWGKAGWPDVGCWRGDVEYGDNWCSFGCAALALDPTNKFADSASDRWTWAGVDLPRCCGPDGFNATLPRCTCRVAHTRSVEDCPPSPYYTNR